MTNVLYNSLKTCHGQNVQNFYTTQRNTHTHSHKHIYIYIYIYKLSQNKQNKATSLSAVRLDRKARKKDEFLKEI